MPCPIIGQLTVGPITANEDPFLRSVPETLNGEGKAKSRWIEPNTLLFTNSGATLGVPKITLIGGCINDGVVALLYVDYTLKLFLYYFLFGQTRLLRTINQGAAQPNLNTGIIREIVVPLPPLSEIEEVNREIERRLSVVLAEHDVVLTNLRRSHRLRQSILKQAFEGKLVEQNSNDDPARILLDQIQAEREKQQTKTNWKPKRGKRASTTRKSAGRKKSKKRSKHAELF